MPTDVGRDERRNRVTGPGKSVRQAHGPQHRSRCDSAGVSRYRRDIRVEGLQDLRVTGLALAAAGTESIVAGVQVGPTSTDQNYVSLAKRLPQRSVTCNASPQCI